MADKPSDKAKEKKLAYVKNQHLLFTILFK